MAKKTEPTIAVPSGFIKDFAELEVELTRAEKLASNQKAVDAAVQDAEVIAGFFNRLIERGVPLESATDLTGNYMETDGNYEVAVSEEDFDEDELV